MAKEVTKDQLFNILKDAQKKSDWLTGLDIEYSCYTDSVVVLSVMDEPQKVIIPQELEWMATKMIRQLHDEEKSRRKVVFSG